MKRIFTLLTFFISILSVCTLSVVEGYGQLTGDNYPVQAHVYVQRPSLKMPEYFSSSTMLRTDLILKDLTKTTLDVYLSWQITGLGLGVEAGTLPGFVPPGYLTLTKGSKRQLSGAELREYFQPGMLAVSGVGENVIFNGKLPEGFYTLKITAYEAGTGRQVSNTAETFFSVAYALPPVINLPLIGSEQPVTRPQSVLLQWMPRHTATGSNRITYSGKVCEVAEDEDPNVAINGSQNCFTIPAQPGTSYVLKASDLPLKVGKRYAFQLQVTDNNDQLEFQNQGCEVSWFRFGEACKPPSGLQVNAIAAGRLNVSWNANPQATGYKLLYRSKNQTEWTEQTTLGTSVSLVSLNPEQDYEFKVITICEVGNESPESETVTWEGEGEIDQELEDLIKKVLNPEGEPIVSAVPRIQRAVPGIEKAIPSGPLPETFEDLIPKDPTKIPCQSQLHSYEECSDVHPEGHIPTADEVLQTLKVGDLITIYDYLVVLTEVSGGNNIFSGKGLVKMPFLEDKKMPVEFSNVEIKRDKEDQNGGCVTAVNGYFRVRTGLTPEQIRQEEIDLIHKVRTNTDPASIYISRGQVITELGEELTTTGKDLCDGKPITEEAKQSLLKKHTLAKQGLQDWAEDAADLYSELDLDGTEILGRIQTLITTLEANIAIINSGEGCPQNPDIKTEMDAIKEKIKEDIEKSKEPTDNLPKITDVVVKNITESEATITWKGDKRFTKYLVSYQTEGQGVVVKEVTKPTLLLSQLDKNKKYNFTIKGIAESSEHTFGPEEFSTLKSSFPPIENLVSTEVENNSSRLTWDKNSKHDSYLIEYINNKGETIKLVTTTNLIDLSELSDVSSLALVTAYDKNKLNSVTNRTALKSHYLENDNGFYKLTTSSLLQSNCKYNTYCEFVEWCFCGSSPAPGCIGCSTNDHNLLNSARVTEFKDVTVLPICGRPKGEKSSCCYVEFYSEFNLFCTNNNDDNNGGDNGNDNGSDPPVIPPTEPPTDDDPCTINISFTTLKPDCNSNTVLLNSDGVLPVSYTIKNSQGIVTNRQSYESVLSISDLPEGNYTISAIDSKGCKSNTVSTTLENNKLSLNISETKDCNNTATLEGICGTPPYKYSIDGITFSETNIFGNLQKKLQDENLNEYTYTFWVKDANDDLASKDLKVTLNQNMVKWSNNRRIYTTSTQDYVNLSVSAEVLQSFSKAGIIKVSAKNHPCDLGSIEIEAPYANLPLDVTITSNTGATIKKTSYSKVFSVDNLESGIYTVSGSDNGGCDLIQSDQNDNRVEIITNKFDFQADVIQSTCISSLVRIRVQNIPGKWRYNVYVDNKLEKDFNTNVNIEVFNIELPPGFHQIRIEEMESGCSKTKNIDILVPQNLVLSGEVKATNGSGSNCTENHRGVVDLTLSVSGGVGPFSYSVHTDVDEQLSINQSAQNNVSFKSIKNVSLNATVTDAYGCSATYNYTPTYTSESLTLSITSDYSCETKGKITANTTEGNQPYLYNLNGGEYQSSPVFENLEAGNYTVTVKDAFNCTENAETTLESNLQIDLETKNAGCPEGGKIMISARCGTGPYSYSIDGGTTFILNQPIFDGLTAGTYNVVVKDAREVTVSKTVELLSTIEEIQVLVTTEEASCSADNGKLKFEAEGGCGEYQYSIDNGETFQAAPEFTDLPAGDYSFVVKDKGNNQFTGQTTVEQEGDTPPESEQFEEPVIMAARTGDAKARTAADGSQPLYIAPDGRAVTLPGGATVEYFVFGGKWGAPPEGTLQGFVINGVKYFAEVDGNQGNAEFKGYRKIKTPFCPAEYFDESIYTDSPGTKEAYYIERWNDDGDCGMQERKFTYSFPAPLGGQIMDIYPYPQPAEGDIYNGKRSYVDKTRCEKIELINENNVKVNPNTQLTENEGKELGEMLDNLNANLGKKLKLSISVIKSKNLDKLRKEARDKKLRIIKTTKNANGDEVVMLISGGGEGWSPCEKKYIDDKLATLHKSSVYNQSSQWIKDLMNTAGTVYHGFFAIYKCSVAEEKYITCTTVNGERKCAPKSGANGAEAFTAGFINSVIDDLDLITSTADVAGLVYDMLKEITQATSLSAFLKYPKELYEVYQTLSTANEASLETVVTPELFLKAIPPPKPTMENLTFLGNIAEFLCKRYVTEGTYYSSGELTAMIVPIGFTGGLYLGKKLPAMMSKLSGRISVVLRETGQKMDLIREFKLGKKIDYHDVGDVRQVIKKDGSNNVENIYEKVGDKLEKICGSCLAINTPVYGTDATLQNLQPHTTVQTLEKDGTTASRSVWGKVSRKVSEVVNIWFNGETIKSTTDHEFISNTGKVAASQIRKGTLLFSLALQSFVPVDSASTIHEETQVEGLMLREVEAYGVGSLGIATAPSNGWCVKGLDLAGHRKVNDWLANKGLSDVDIQDITRNLETHIDAKTIYAVEEATTGRFIIQADRGAMTNKTFVVEPKQGGGYAVNKYEPTYDPLANPDIDVDISTKSYLVPDYSTKGGQYLHPTNHGKTIKIEMKGNREGDYTEALNELRRQIGNESFPRPDGYTWHHMDDFEYVNGKAYCTMQLVETSKHTTVGMAHSGSVAQYKTFGLNGY